MVQILVFWKCLEYTKTAIEVENLNNQNKGREKNILTHINHNI